MGRPSKVVDRDEAIRLLQGGATYSEMIEFYREKYGVETDKGIWSRFYRKHVDPDGRQVNKYDYIPWVTGTQPKGSRYFAGLRAIARENSGEPMSLDATERARQTRARLISSDCVIDYVPEEDRLIAVPRRHWIDQGWVRDPFIDDSGKFIEPSMTVRGKSWVSYKQTGGLCLVDFARPLAEGEDVRQALDLSGVSLV